MRLSMQVMKEFCSEVCIEALAMQGEQKNSYPSGPPNTTDDSDPYVTHMNPKTLLKASYIGTFNSVQVCSSVVSVFES